MIVWELFEIIVEILLGLIILTQVVLPPLLGLPFFWFFRYGFSSIKIQDKISQKNAEKVLKDLKRKEK